MEAMNFDYSLKVPSKSAKLRTEVTYHHTYVFAFPFELLARTTWQPEKRISLLLKLRYIHKTTHPALICHLTGNLEGKQNVSINTIQDP